VDFPRLTQTNDAGRGGHGLPTGSNAHGPARQKPSSWPPAVVQTPRLLPVAAQLTRASLVRRAWMGRWGAITWAIVSGKIAEIRWPTLLSRTGFLDYERTAPVSSAGASRLTSPTAGRIACPRYHVQRPAARGLRSGPTATVPCSAIWMVLSSRWATGSSRAAAPPPISRRGRKTIGPVTCAEHVIRFAHRFRVCGRSNACSGKMYRAKPNGPSVFLTERKGRYTRCYYYGRHTTPLAQKKPEWPVVTELDAVGECQRVARSTSDYSAADGRTGVLEGARDLAEADGRSRQFGHDRLSVPEDCARPLPLVQASADGLHQIGSHPLCHRPEAGVGGHDAACTARRPLRRLDLPVHCRHPSHASPNFCLAWRSRCAGLHHSGGP